MAKSIEEELAYYKKLFGIGDIATRAYVAVVKVLEQQVDFLQSFNVKDSITKAAKDDPVYARAIEMWEELPDMVLKMKKLKDELGIEYVENEEKPLPISPQRIAHLKSSI